MINFGQIRSFAGAAIASTLGGGTIPLIIGAALVASHSIAYFKGGSHQAAQCQVAALNDTIDAQVAAIGRLKSQLAVARQVSEAANRRWEIDNEETLKSKAEADALKLEIRNRVEPDHKPVAKPGKTRVRTCRPVGLSADDAKRLRRIGR